MKSGTQDEAEGKGHQVKGKVKEIRRGTERRPNFGS